LAGILQNTMVLVSVKSEKKVLKRYFWAFFKQCSFIKVHACTKHKNGLLNQKVAVLHCFWKILHVKCRVLAIIAEKLLLHLVYCFSLVVTLNKYHINYNENHHFSSARLSHKAAFFCFKNRPSTDFFAP